MVGSQLGGYRLRRKLGEGGMGEVYLAEHSRLDRRAAIKVLLPMHSTNGDAVARFFAEARAASVIHHPVIVEVFDCDVHPSGRAFIVMEYLEGATLADVLASVGPLHSPAEIPTAVALTAEVATGLRAAHERGVVHRDIKTDNIIVGPHATDGVTRLCVKVLDFGIAKLSSGIGAEGPVSNTKSGFFLGTPVYMSPEQCRAAGRVDHRTDIYSLGCILFELVSGRPPFVATTFGDLVAAQLTQRPALLRELNPAVPEVLEDLVASMLAKDPAERPQSMTEVLAVLERPDLGVPAAQRLQVLGRSEALAAALEKHQQRREREAQEEALRLEPSSPGEAGRRGPATMELGGARPAGTPLPAGELTTPQRGEQRPRVWLWVTGAGLAVGIAAAMAVAWPRHPSSTGGIAPRARQAAAEVRPPRVEPLPSPEPHAPPPLASHAEPAPVAPPRKPAKPARSPNAKRAPTPGPPPHAADEFPMVAD